MGLIAIAVKATDRGPVFFRQPRAGEDGVPFLMVKFRSMSVSGTSDSELDSSTWLKGVPDEFVFKTSGSSATSITRVGGLLRRTSLDELPQLFNVLAGDMSLVGPRPEILPIASRYNDAQRRRLTVKPGVTGWAQLNGRASHNHGEKISADLYYVDHACLSLDVRILLRSLVVPFHGKHAY